MDGSSVYFFEPGTNPFKDRHMSKPKSKLVIFVFFTFLILQNCIPEAPHDNPLDPSHFSSVNSSSVTGSVSTLYPPHTQLPDVTVFVKEAGRIVQTNNTGNFQIDNLNPGNYTVIASKENYQSDTLTVFLQTKTNLEIGPIYMNAVPQLKDIKYFSEIKSTIFSIDPLKNVVVDISVEDYDGVEDIDSVYAWAPDFSFKRAIDINDPDGLVIQQTDSLGFNLDNLLESPLYIILKDKPGFKTTAGPFFIHRFITQNPVPVSPIDLEVALQPLFFTWEKVEHPYSFTYEINIVRHISNTREEVFKKTGISPNETSFSFNQILDNGFYFWQIAIRDNQNNLNQSIEAIFQIQ